VTSPYRSIRLTLELLLFLFLIVLFSLGCSTKKCQRFFTYRTTQVDLKGISSKLEKNGISTNHYEIGSILIDPKFVKVSEELQRLDLYQKTLCEQLNLITNDSLRTIRRQEYVSTLISMIKIAQHPDTLLEARVERLEDAEERRTIAENYSYNLKKTPPEADLRMFIHPDGRIMYLLTILNDVPFHYDATLYRTDGVDMMKNMIILGPDPTIYPGKEKQYILPTGRKLDDPLLPQDSIFEVKLAFHYYSIFLDEVRAPNLDKWITKYYLINRRNKGVLEVTK
jgi:hypothetical protein